MRTLLVLQTLLCVYLSCWWPTQRYGLDDVREYSDERFPYGATSSQSFNRSPTVFLPLLVQRTEFDPISNNTYHRMYAWLFGYVVKVPGEGKARRKGQARGRKEGKARRGDRPPT